MKKVAVIQARLTSSRLPNKVLKNIEEKTILMHIIDRIGAAKLIDEYVVAIPNNNGNTLLREYLENNEIPFIVGDEDNVLSRFVEAGEKYSADILIRITADNPLTSSEYIDFLVEKHIAEKLDYSYVIGLPKGMASEVMSFKLLKDISEEKNLKLEHLEHVTMYFKDYPGKFKIKYIDCLPKHLLPKASVTVDTEKDYEHVRKIFKLLKKRKLEITSDNVIEVLK